MSDKTGNPPPYQMGGEGQVQYPPPQYNNEPQQYPPAPQGQQYPPQQYPPQQGYPPQQQYPPQQGYPQAGAQQVVVVQQQYQATPPSNQILAWISCLCFFWPLGCVAVFKSMESDKCAGKGDIEGARSNGESARKWAIAAIITQIVLGIAVGIIYGVILAVTVSNAINYDYDLDNY